jgi:hypothetical protein
MSTGNKIQLFINTVGENKTFALLVDDASSVTELKQLINEFKPRILLYGRILNSSKTLAENGLVNDSTVKVL